jgi:phosphoadenosine phosphosulfate reductase
LGFKPIFEEERQFFKENTNIELPTDCWRNGSKIYLDITCDKPIYQFKVDNKQIKITKNNSKYFKDYNQIKIPDLIKDNVNRLNTLWDESVKATQDMILKYHDYFWIISHSGGKDSTVAYEVWKVALHNVQKINKDLKVNYVINFANTSNDTADTYKYIKSLPKDKLHILNPKQGWRQWIVKTKNYFIPSAMVRNCCSQYKEGQITKAYDNNVDTISLIGVRKFESAKRSKYEMIMDNDWRDKNFTTNTIPKRWTNFAPIINWKDEDVWLFILSRKLNFNRQYRLGFNRCGCLICPYQSDYTDLIIEKYYPQQWSWWENVLQKNYEIWHVFDRLKWTFEEYRNGKWKAGTSKIQELIQSKPTSERLKEVAELQGISENMAEKYFNKKCKCGKKMNPNELAMFYKTYGRYEDVKDDQRELLCKKCFCKENNITEKEYTQKSIEFRDNGCKLF